MSFNLGDLNTEQRRAVETVDGALLVLAGAGSGKTRVITSRIANLILNRKVPPSSILAVTFTNKAAREMGKKVRGLIGKGYGRKARASTKTFPGSKAASPPESPTICTFHSFGVRLLRAHITLLDYRQNFVIFDDSDQLGLVTNLLVESDYDLALYSPKSAHSALQSAKSKGVTAEELLAQRDAPDQVMLGGLMGEYQKALKGMNALDFEDILLLSLRVCREHPVQAASFFQRYRYVMVDEYQDTNRAQYELLQHVTAEHGNLCVVGDDDQSIYRWRGAEPGNILDFERDFPGSTTIRLERNYRSSDTILETANQIIRNNKNRKAKQLYGGQGTGPPLEWLLGEDEAEELEKVVLHLKRTRLEKGSPLSDFAILYRSNHQSRGVEEVLRDEGIPYHLVGGLRFYDRREIKDALAYLRLIFNPADEISLYRIINFPRRGIGRTSLTRLNDAAGNQARSVFEIMQEATSLNNIPPEAARSMEHFTTMILEYQERFKRGALGETFRDLLEEVGYHRAVEADRPTTDAGERAAANVRELELATDRFAQNRPGKGLREYLEHIALFTLPIEEEEGKERAAVTLMTVHSSKGLEFPFVYLIGMADDIFPHRLALAEDGEEEERRLCYVAVTRAKKRLVFSMGKKRKRFGEIIVQQPSRFLAEIEPRLFADDAPSTTAPSKAVRERKAQKAKKRFFEQMKNIKEAAGGE